MKYLTNAFNYVSSPSSLHPLPRLLLYYYKVSVCIRERINLNTPSGSDIDFHCAHLLGFSLNGNYVPETKQRAAQIEFHTTPDPDVTRCDVANRDNSDERDTVTIDTWYTSLTTL